LAITGVAKEPAIAATAAAIDHDFIFI